MKKFLLYAPTAITLMIIVFFSQGNDDFLGIKAAFGYGGGGGPYLYLPYTKKIETKKYGDANEDGKVDKYDFSLMMSNWGKTGSNISDLNGDGVVDRYDFALLMLNWNI